MTGPNEAQGKTRALLPDLIDHPGPIVVLDEHALTAPSVYRWTPTFDEALLDHVREEAARAGRSQDFLDAAEMLLDPASSDVERTVALAYFLETGHAAAVGEVPTVGERDE